MVMLVILLYHNIIPNGVCDFVSFWCVYQMTQRKAQSFQIN